jgi:hypothetical protein
MAVDEEQQSFLTPPLDGHLPTLPHELIREIADGLPCSGDRERLRQAHRDFKAAIPAIAKTASPAQAGTPAEQCPRALWYHAFIKPRDAIARHIVARSNRGYQQRRQVPPPIPSSLVRTYSLLTLLTVYLLLSVFLGTVWRLSTSKVGVRTSWNLSEALLHDCEQGARGTIVIRDMLDLCNYEYVQAFWKHLRRLVTVWSPSNYRLSTV